MRIQRLRPRLWAAATAVAVAGLAATTLTAPAATAGPLDNPSWGRALPPADAPTGRAYDLVVENNDKGYAPRDGECSKEIHARYWTYGPDGKVYPTWHPPRDSGGCAFGHEHGDDPRNSELFSTADWPAFGYTSEVLAETTGEGSHRHEDHVGPAVPPDSPSDTGSLGRLITDASCVQAIREGRTHYEPITGTNIPFDTNDLHEFWFSDVRVSGSQLNFTIAPLFYVLNPSRYFDAGKPNNLARQADLCYEGVRGEYCDQVRQITQQTGRRVPWDDPRSPFKGSLREFRPGTFTLNNSGPTTVYTDVYGRNASTTPFNGSIKQYFSGNSPERMYVRGATRDWAANPSDRIHAPN